MKVRLIKTFDFEAAHTHTVPGSAAPCLHGHRFYVHVCLDGPINPELGWLIDFAEIGNAVKPLIAQLDHRFLNGIEGLERGAPEEIASWMKKGLNGLLPFPLEVEVTCRESMVYKPVLIPPDSIFNFTERISFRFEAAHSLPKTPEGHKCRRLHGHSYEIQAVCEEQGETLYRLEKIHSLLNYSHLNLIPGLENPTAEILCSWIWDHLKEDGLTPMMVSTGETCESRCVYMGD